MMWKKRETLDLLVRCETLLQGFDTLTHHRIDLPVPAQLFTVVELDVVLLCPFLQHIVFGNNQCRDELPLVGDDGNLLDELIHQQHALHHLRRDVFAVGSLEEMRSLRNSSPSLR